MCRMFHYYNGQKKRINQKVETLGLLSKVVLSCHCGNPPDRYDFLSFFLFYLLAAGPVGADFTLGARGWEFFFAVFGETAEFCPTPTVRRLDHFIDYQDAQRTAERERGDGISAPCPLICGERKEKKQCNENSFLVLTTRAKMSAAISRHCGGRGGEVTCCSLAFSQSLTFVLASSSLCRAYTQKQGEDKYEDDETAKKGVKW